jgi:adenylate kinase
VTRPPVRALISGVPAAGKSTIATLAALSRPETKIHELGEAMTALAVAQGLAQSVESLPTLGDYDRARLQAEAAEPLRHVTGPFLVVAHLLVLGPNGMRPGLPPAARDAIAPNRIVVLECAPAEIARRRAEGGRVRTQPEQPPDVIDVHQRQVLAEAAAFAADAGTRLAVVRSDQPLPGAAADLAAFLWG